MTSEVAKLQGAGGAVDWVEAALAGASKMQGENPLLPEQVRQRIAEARTTWSKIHFPTSRIESWKYTNPEPIARGVFSMPVQAAVDAEIHEVLASGSVQGLVGSTSLVFVDGAFSEKLSVVATESGVEVSRLAEGKGPASRVASLEQHCDEAFAALATALVTDGVCISVKPGCASQLPVQVVHVMTSASQGSVVTPRIYVEAGDNSRVTVIESHVAAVGVRYLSLPVVELVAGQGAFIDYYKVQVESEDAFHVAGITATQAKDSEVRTHLFEFGGALVRNNAQVMLKGSGAQAVLNGLSLLRNEQHVDNATLIHHIEPHAESREHFKGIYGGSSKGVFSGTITVDKIAQKTNAFQSNQALLLSPNASIESRPQLKIWADDVKCTHGATVGQLNADALFYLRSRGIGLQDAQAFLVHAFASEVLSSVTSAQVKGHVEQLISQKLTNILS
jgi:Fe-S cluster assembly protein SufD